MTAATSYITRSHRGDICVYLPGTRVRSELNERAGWRPLAARAKQHRNDALFAMRGALVGKRVLFPCEVTLTRVAPSSGLDGDNLQGSLKAIRDGVADALGIDDGGDEVKWLYEQRRPDPTAWAKWAVEITLRARNA